MLTFSESQKRGWLEEFSNVTALYQVFNESRNTHRTKRAEYRCDEVAALPIDFLMDVELKAKRVLPMPTYEMFLRLVVSSNLELLPMTAKLLLGNVWKEYGLGIEGSYRTLYFKTKNEQIRNFLKGTHNGDASRDTQGNTINSDAYTGPYGIISGELAAETAD